MPSDIVRDRLTWTAYVLLAWFAYLQAAPGLVVTHLRDELDLSYSTGGLYVAGFAGGSAIAGVLYVRLEHMLGRRAVLWSGAALLGAGTLGLTAFQTAELSVGSACVMGLGGGVVLASIQAVLADHHPDQQTVALAEANVAASVSYVLLVGMLSAAAVAGLGWRAALLVSLVVPLIASWVGRGRGSDDSSASGHDRRHDRLPTAFWIAAGILVCTTAVEWAVTAWGATLVQESADVSADTAVALMAGYFGGFLAGRVIGSRLARQWETTRLLAIALGTAAVGFVILWSAAAPMQAVAGLGVLGLGVGNLYPMAVSLAVSLAPGRAGSASARAVVASAAAVLFTPLTIGTLADAMSLKAAFAAVPVLLVLAACGMAVLARALRRPAGTAGLATAADPD